MKAEIQFVQLSVLTGLLAASACGGHTGSKKQPTPEIGDGTPPSVVVALPANGAQDVNLLAAVKVTFSEPIAEQSLTSETFNVAGLPGTITYDAPSQVATFVADDPWPQGTELVATVGPGIEDVAGTVMKEPYVWHFVTVQDVEPPSIISTVPSANATGVSLDATVTVLFDGALDLASVDSAAFYITDVPSTVTYNAQTYEVTLTPDAALAFATTYEVHVTSAVRDLAQNHLAQEAIWSFTTEPDTYPPTVVSTTPATDATDVDPATAVVAELSEAVLDTTVDAVAFELRDASDAVVAAQVSLDASSRIATLTPDSPLVPEQTYTAKLASTIEDLSGNTLAQPYTWSFTIAKDTTPPEIVSTTPADGALDVALNPSITVVFSEPCAAATVTPAQFDVNGIAPTYVSRSSDSMQATVVFPKLAYATTYVFTASTGIEDLYGNTLAAPYTMSFTTLVDTVPPYVTSSSPIDGAHAVPSALAAITARFSEAMAPSTLNASTVTVTGPGNAPIAGTVSYDDVSLQVTFEPAAPLPAGWVVFAISSGTTDAQGVALTPWSAQFHVGEAANVVSGITTPTIGDVVASTDDSGRTLVVWTAEAFAGTDVISRSYDANTSSWSAENVVDTVFDGRYTDLHLISRGTDHLLVWRGSSGLVARLWDGTFGGDHVLDATGDVGPVQVAENGRHYGVAWEPAYYVSGPKDTHVAMHNGVGWSAVETPHSGSAALAAPGTAALSGQLGLLYRDLTFCYRYGNSSAFSCQANPIFVPTEGTIDDYRLTGSGRDYMAYYVHKTTAITATPYKLYVRRRNGTSWQAPIELANSANKLFFNVGANDESDLALQQFVVAWADSSTGPGARVYTNGAWGAALDYTGGMGLYTTPVLVASGQSFLAHWRSNAGTAGNHYASVWSAGAWGAVENLGASSSLTSSVATCGEGGSFGVAYKTASLVAHTYESGAWKSPVPLDAQAQSAGAIAPAGSHFLVAAGRGGSTGAFVRTASGWSSRTTLSQSAHSGSVREPILVSLSSGALAVWLQYVDGTILQLHAARATGSGFTTSQVVESGSVAAFAVASNGDTAVVMYRLASPTVSTGTVYARRFVAATDSWGGAITLGTFSGGNELDVASGEGSYMAVWKEGADVVYRTSANGSSWAAEAVADTDAYDYPYDLRLGGSPSGYGLFYRRNNLLQARFSHASSWSAETDVGTVSSAGVHVDVAPKSTGVYVSYGTQVRSYDFNGSTWDASAAKSHGKYQAVLVSGASSLLILGESGGNLSAARYAGGALVSIGTLGSQVADFAAAANGDDYLVLFSTDAGVLKSLTITADSSKGSLEPLNANVAPVFDVAVAGAASGFVGAWAESDTTMAGARLLGAEAL